MDPTVNSDLAIDLSPMIRIYKDGRIERLMGTETVPPSLDSKTGVVSKDIVYSPDLNLSVRIYVPKKLTDGSGDDQKLPLLVYFHGGAFIIETAFAPTYHDYINTLVSEAGCVAVSVDYRLAPENPIPAAYDDSWEALKWVAGHSGGSGPEEWLNKYADLGKVFLAGDSAGANITHHMAMKIAHDKLSNGSFGITGIILVHPFFWGKTPVDDKETTNPTVRKMIEGIWRMASPSSEKGCDDPRIDVVTSGPSLETLGCKRVLVCVAQTDTLVRQGWCYVDKLKNSGWSGEVEILEAVGEGHVFHLLNPLSVYAAAMIRKIVEFIRK